MEYGDTSARPKTRARTALRRLLPAAVVLLLVLGSLTWQGMQHGMYGSSFALALLTVAAITVIAGLLCYCARWLDRDETARRTVEEELRRSSRYFELSRDMVCTAGLDGYFKQLNAAWTQTLGWSAAELRSRPFVELVHPDDRAATERESAGLAQGGLARSFVNRYATKDGGWRWIDWRAMASVEDGLIYASARDVTHGKAAEAALEASARQTRQILETAHDAFISIDERGLITDWNPQAQASLGWSRQEVLGRELAATIIPEGHREAHRRGIDRFLATGQARVLGQRLELTALHRDGRELPVELTISAVETKTGYSFNAFLRDITERRAVERAKDEFVSIVSHELRTPLTSIRGSLGLLAGGVLAASPAKAERMLQIALENSDRLVRLINDILDIERIESDNIDMHQQPCDGAELVDRAVRSVGQIAADAQVGLIAEGEPVALPADPDRVLQTLTNLISNAVKFSPVGSTVRVSSRRSGDDEALFEVSDRGRGIPADKLESIFERFAQVDASDSREKGGTGLGLAICRKIVERHGGHIWVDSELGVGSTFSFALPAPAPNGSAPPEPVDGRPVILVCDDDPAILEVVGSVLEDRGYRVIAAASGEVAIEQAIAEHPDVILLDLLMPGMSGWETLRTLREHEETVDIPVVILSVKPPCEGEMPSGEAVDWIEKSADDAAVITAVERAVGSRDQILKVLLVEDDPSLAEVLTAIFERHGVESFVATDGREAIELCQRMLPDLLVLDVGLPDLDGFEVVDWLRRHERLSALPIVVYTARDLEDADRERLMLGSITQFLTKGQITPEEFERRVMTLLAPTRPLTRETHREPEAHSARR